MVNEQRTILHIDGDMLVYMIGYASESETMWPDGLMSHDDGLKSAKRFIQTKLNFYQRLFDADDIEIVLTGSGNWRFNFYPEYKANRKVLTKPTGYDVIRKHMQEDLGAITINEEEADDYLAQKLTEPHPANERHILLSADKDFFTVPGEFCNLTSRRVFKGTMEQVFCFLFFQGLVGDRVDGYYGVDWVGKAKAKRLLKACDGLTVRQAYLLLKIEIKGKRGKEAWLEFRKCIDLAALRWYNETGCQGIALRRVRKYSTQPFTYYLPYYEISHNISHGQVIEGFTPQ